MKKVALCLAVLILAGALKWAVTAQSPSPGPIEFYRATEEAGRLMRSQEFSKATPLLENLARQDPLNGALWWNLGESRFHQQQFVPAAEAYERSLPIGFRNPGFVSYRVAQAYARAGRKPEALQWLQKALANGYDHRPQIWDDSNFASLRAEPRFAEIAGILPKTADRNMAWRQDLDFLVAEIRRVHYLYRAQALPEGFDAARRALYDDIPRLSDDLIKARMQGLLARLGDGHSVVFLFAGERPLLQIPLRMYFFSDGLFVIDAAEPYRQWIGSRVQKIGSFTPEEALRRLEPFISKDNAMFLKAAGPGLYLNTPALLQAAGLLSDPARVPLTLRDREGRSATVNVEPTTPERLVKFLTPPAISAAARLPLYLQRQDQNFWFQHIPEKNAVYVQFNAVGDAPQEPLRGFAARLRRFVSENPVQNMVVDIRHNSGGNRQLLPAMWRTLIHFETTRENPRLFIITGRATFSAAQVFLSHAYFLTSAVIVGECSSSRPNFVGEDTETRLPHSGLFVSISSQYHQANHLDHRPCINPEIPVELSSEDYFANRDPALDAIWQLLSAPGSR